MRIQPGYRFRVFSSSKLPPPPFLPINLRHLLSLYFGETSHFLISWDFSDSPSVSLTNGRRRCNNQPISDPPSVSHPRSRAPSTSFSSSVDCCCQLTTTATAENGRGCNSQYLVFSSSNPLRGAEIYDPSVFFVFPLGTRLSVSKPTPSSSNGDTGNALDPIIYA